jgi:hypothetical protein
MYKRGSLSLDRLLIYSDIYSLGITQADIDHLKVVFTAYKGQSTDMIYIYKPATAGYDLILALDERPDAFIDIVEHEAAVDAAGYPAVHVGNIYLKFLPQIADLPFLNSAADFIHRDTITSGHVVFNSIDEVRGYVIDHELPTYKPDYYRPLDMSTIDMLYRACAQTPPMLSILKKDYDDVPDYVSHIVAVLTIPKDDTRVAFYISKLRRNTYYGSSTIFDLPMGFYITKVGEPAYNWTDPDRWFSHLHRETFKPQVFYSDADPVFPKVKDAIDVHRRGQNVITIDNNTLDILMKRWVRKQQDIENEKAAIKTLEKKLKERIAELALGKDFTYNDVTFRKNEFEYEGQKISCKDIAMEDILAKFSGYYSEDHLNFDRVLDTWLAEIYKEATKAKKNIRGNIGDVSFEVACTLRKSKNGVEALIYRVNGHRINKDEVTQVLGRAICFPDNAIFDEFCETVAACSLKYHKYLAGGILIETHDEIFNQTIEFKIALERIKNKNYIAFNGKRFKIGDTNRLLTLLNSKGMVRVIDLLLDPKVAGLDSSDIQTLLTTGRQALIDQRAKEEDLLKSTMSMFDIEKVEEFKAQNGKLLSGYLVKGALRNYVVDEDQLLVYEHPTGRYICMVDKGQNEHTNTTRLVNRFFALSNDSKLAKDISTL